MSTETFHLAKRFFTLRKRVLLRSVHFKIFREPKIVGLTVKTCFWNLFSFKPLWLSLKYLEKCFSVFCPYNESHCGPVLFWPLLTFIVRTKTVILNIDFHYGPKKESHIEHGMKWEWVIHYLFIFTHTFWSFHCYCTGTSS